jgi:hypothetical protein
VHVPRAGGMLVVCVYQRVGCAELTCSAPGRQLEEHVRAAMTADSKMCVRKLMDLLEIKKKPKETQSHFSEIVKKLCLVLNLASRFPCRSTSDWSGGQAAGLPLLPCVCRIRRVCRCM